MVKQALMVAAVTAALAKDLVSASSYFTGDGTAYTLSMPSSGNCNFMSALSTASSNYAALNQAQWDSLGNCGRCAEVSCIDSRCTSKKTEVVQILDRCPECKQGDLDLSPTVFKSITGSDPSRLTIQWRFVECPKPGNIKVCLKEGSNANWVAVQPTNFAVGVKSVTVAGAATTMLDGAYYYVHQTGSVDLSSVAVTITSINGDVVKGTYSLSSGSCVDTGKQFASSGSDSSTTPTAPIATTAAPAATTAAPSPVATTAAPSPTAAPAPVATATAAPTTNTTSPSTEESESGDDEYDNSTSDDDYDDDETDSSSDSDATEAPATTTAPAATTQAPATATTDAPVSAKPTSPGKKPSKCHVRF